MDRSPHHTATETLASTIQTGKTEPRVRSLVEQAPTVTYTRSAGNAGALTSISPQVEALLGLSPDELLGHANGIAGRIHPDDRAGVAAEGARARATGEPFVAEYRIEAWDGRWVHVRDEAALARDAAGQPLHWQGVIVDITERKATELALLRSVQQAETLLESALDCVIMADSDGRIVRFNRAAERTFGYRREEAVGQPIIDLLTPPHVREAFTQEFARLLASGTAVPFGERHETTALRADGSCFPIELTITVIAEENEPLFIAFVRDTTQRVAAEEALRASEERFRGLVQGSHDIITVVDRDGRRRYVSPSIESELGYSVAEHLAAASVFELIHPDDVPLLRAAIAEIVAGAGRTPPLELRLRHRDGGWRIFETIGTNHLQTPHIAGIVFNSREITWRKATEAALRESEARFRAAFDFAPIGLAIFMPDGEIRQVNRSLCTLLGCHEAQLVQMRFPEIVHPDDLADAEELAGRLFAGEITNYAIELRLLRSSGSPVWTELTVSGVHEAERPRRAIAQIQDITGRRNLDLERATMLASERAYAKRLRELATMRADFSAMVAHELRAPIAALRMMTATLETGALPLDAEGEMLAAMQGQIDQLDRLMNDVAAAASVEQANFSVQLHAVPLPMLITGVASAAAGALAEHPLSVGPAPELQVWCDPERISQVLGNLLENAAKHTPPGTPVALRAIAHDDRVRIEVADRGPGIPEDDLAVVFEKFGRGRQAIDRQSPGLGLGLYLSAQIAHAHGTELTAGVTPEGETVFGFDLRVAR